MLESAVFVMRGRLCLGRMVLSLRFVRGVMGGFLRSKKLILGEILNIYYSMILFSKFLP